MQGFTPVERDLAGTDSGAHARLAQGLREAARYIETHPDLPIPRDAGIHFCITADSDKAGEDEAYRIAQILGAKVAGDGGDAKTERAFGPAVSYQAAYITQDRMAAYDAHMAPYYAARRVADIRADLAATREGRAA